MCVCVCVCVRAAVRACVRLCVRAGNIKSAIVIDSVKVRVG